MVSKPVIGSADIPQSTYGDFQRPNLTGRTNLSSPYSPYLGNKQMLPLPKPAIG